VRDLYASAFASAGDLSDEMSLLCYDPRECAEEAPAKKKPADLFVLPMQTSVQKSQIRRINKAADSMGLGG
jgi:hypothetical protein